MTLSELKQVRDKFVAADIAMHVPVVKELIAAIDTYIAAAEAAAK